jgi:hypothetical protein
MHQRTWQTPHLTPYPILLYAIYSTLTPESSFDMVDSPRKLLKGPSEEVQMSRAHALVFRPRLTSSSNTKYPSIDFFFVHFSQVQNRYFTY